MTDCELDLVHDNVVVGVVEIVPAIVSDRCVEDGEKDKVCTYDFVTLTDGLESDVVMPNVTECDVVFFVAV